MIAAQWTGPAPEGKPFFLCVGKTGESGTRTDEWSQDTADGFKDKNHAQIVTAALGVKNWKPVPYPRTMKPEIAPAVEPSRTFGTYTKR